MPNTTLNVSDYYVRPCINGNSSTGEYFNFSVDFDHCFGNCSLNKQPGASIVSPILLSLTGITGQICALVYLHRSTRPSSHRTTFYVMLATLIWTDLIGKLIATPLPVYSYVRGHWVGGAPTCNIHGYSMSLIGIVTHLLVAAMALERYLGIRCGYFYNRNVTTHRARILCTSIWAFGLTYCSLPLLGIGKFKLHYPGTWCHINQHLCMDQPWPDIVFSNLYSIINLCLLCITVFCNLVVVGSLLKMRVTKYKPSKSVEQVPTSKKSHEREIQMVILLVIITVTFVCSWAAHDLLMFKNQIWPPPPNRNPLLDIKAIRLVSLNQIIDPWSYIICRMIFRSKLWKSCNRILIGKMNVRRFSSRMDGESIFQSIAGKGKFFSHDHELKRASMPRNSRDVKSPERDPLSQDKLVQHKPSFDRSTNYSESEHECKVDLQSCFPTSIQPKRTTTKRNQLIVSFIKLFKKKSKEESYISVQHPPTASDRNSQSKNLTMLVPFTIPLGYPAFNASSLHTHSLTVTAIQGRTHKRSNSSTSDFEGNDPSNLTALHAKGFGSSTNSLLLRSNSWCCPNEYTTGKQCKKI